MYPSHPIPEAEGPTDKASLVFGVVMFGLHNRICTLPTPRPKRPTDKASYILGVVSFGSEDQNGKYNLHTPGSKGPRE